jgi:hypothetical protein
VVPELAPELVEGLSRGMAAVTKTNSKTINLRTHLPSGEAGWGFLARLMGQGQCMCEGGHTNAAISVMGGVRRKPGGGQIVSGAP